MDGNAYKVRKEELKKYCSRECLNHADYERNAEAHRKTRVEKYHQEKRAAGTK